MKRKEKKLKSKQEKMNKQILHSLKVVIAFKYKRMYNNNYLV